MNCPLCGEVCRCHSEPPPSVLPRWRSDPEGISAPRAPVLSAPEAETGDAQLSGLARETGTASVVQAPEGNFSAESAAQCGARAGSDESEADNSAWRDELSVRLNRYRARRKMQPPRYPSLRLPFDASESVGPAEAPSAPAVAPTFEPVSDHALALDGMSEVPTAAGPAAQPSHERPAHATPHSVSVPAGHTAKILEFPRFAWGPPPPLPDQLAEPVSERPRILEAPEVVPPPPALGGITIEAPERPQDEKRPGIDIPLQSASLARRIVASGIDGLIVGAASALFGYIFWKVAAVRPPLVQLLGLAAGIPALFWVAYQYLLIVYGASTPGLRVAGLQLSRFDGTSTSRSLRRWRVLAACLSAVSLGMGYAWVFLDEDVLCWHDRITHTYLAPKRRNITGVPSAT